MSKYVIDSSTLVSIGDAVREKDGTTAPIVVSDLATRIKAIETGGGGGVELPAEAYLIKGNCVYRFANNGWNWYIDLFKDKLTTKDIINCGHMFDECTNLITIPFNMNVSKANVAYGYMFSNCNHLTNVPLILPQETIPPPTGAYSGMIDISYIFYSCYRLREIPYDYFNNFITQEHFEKAMTLNGGSRSYLFAYCNSLRQHPDLSRLPTGQTSSYGTLYNNLFRNCLVLDEIVDLPVIKANYTSNVFADTFTAAGRLKNILFKTNEDGSPIAVVWKNQAIHLSSYVGSENSIVNITSYDSGITVDKQVKDAATYEALKSDEDWWTLDVNYSRYNHDSAVNTINSLPDVSAGSGNTIKFKGAQGALTDGGAINTLTEAEIAVAAAKGWTVSFT
jgi:hypothetical protein